VPERRVGRAFAIQIRAASMMDELNSINRMGAAIIAGTRSVRLVLFAQRAPCHANPN